MGKYILLDIYSYIHIFHFAILVCMWVQSMYAHRILLIHFYSLHFLVFLHQLLFHSFQAHLLYFLFVYFFSGFQNSAGTKISWDGRFWLPWKGCTATIWAPSPSALSSSRWLSWSGLSWRQVLKGGFIMYRSSHAICYKMQYKTFISMNIRGK